MARRRSLPPDRTVPPSPLGSRTTALISCSVHRSASSRRADVELYRATVPSELPTRNPRRRCEGAITVGSAPADASRRTTRHTGGACARSTVGERARRWLTWSSGRMAVSPGARLSESMWRRSRPRLVTAILGMKSSTCTEPSAPATTRVPPPIRKRAERTATFTPSTGISAMSGLRSTRSPPLRLTTARWAWSSETAAAITSDVGGVSATHFSSSALHIAASTSPAAVHAQARTLPSPSMFAVTPLHGPVRDSSYGSAEDRQRALVVLSPSCQASLNRTLPTTRLPASVRTASNPWISWSAATTRTGSSKRTSGDSPPVVGKAMLPSGRSTHTISRRGSLPATSPS